MLYFFISIISLHMVQNLFILRFVSSKKCIATICIIIACLDSLKRHLFFFIQYCMSTYECGYCCHKMIRRYFSVHLMITEILTHNCLDCQNGTIVVLLQSRHILSQPRKKKFRFLDVPIWCQNTMLSLQ